MKKWFFFFMIVFPMMLNAQYWEIGGYLGASNYNGEFSEKPIEINQTHIAYGGIVRANLSRHIAIRGSIIKGMISGTDQNAVKYYHRRWTRNLSFRNPIVDITIAPELNILGFRTNHYTYWQSPYIFAGVTVYKMNPQALYDDKWVNLQPLGTEGQFIKGYEDRRYNLTQFAIPFGFGWKFSIGSNINIGIEASARKTFTDYLDDCSASYVDLKGLYYRNGQIAVNLSNRTGEVNNERIDKVPDVDMRGSPESKDWYYFLGVTVSYSLLPRGCIGY